MFRSIDIAPGVPASLITRVQVLEDNEYKVAYFASVSASSGTITIPTQATILADQFPGGVDALVSTISVGQPTGINPQTGLGATVDVTSFDTLGNYVLSGTPSAYPVALIYILKIKAKYFSNLNINNILEYAPVNNLQGVSLTTNYLPVVTSPNQLGNSYLSQSVAGVKIDATKQLLDSTGTNYIDLYDSNTGITLYSPGNRVNINGGLYTTNTLQSQSGYVTGDSTHLGYVQFGNGTNGFIHKISAGVNSANIFYTLPITGPSTGQVLSSTNTGVMSWTTPTAGTVTSVSGTVNRISVATGTTTPVIDIDAGYIGQSTITTIGTITTGTLGSGSKILVGSDATGDIYYNGGSGAITRLAAGAAGKFLMYNGVGAAPIVSTLVLPNSLTANYLLFGSATNTVGSNLLLQFDGTTFTANGMIANASGIGIGATPDSTSILSIAKSQASTTSLKISNVNTGNGAYTDLTMANNAGSLVFGLVGGNTTTSGIYIQNAAYWETSGGITGGMSLNVRAGNLRFYINSVQAMILDSSSNFGIGVTSAGPRLHVVKTTEQLRVGYDASNYYSTTIGSTGGVTFDAVGSGAAFTFSDGVSLATAKSLTFASGTNTRAGNATLVAGTVTVNNTTVTANTIVILTRKTSGGTIGTAITYTLSASTSFTITSDSVLDTSTFSYMLIENP